MTRLLRPAITISIAMALAFSVTAVSTRADVLYVSTSPGNNSDVERFTSTAVGSVFAHTPTGFANGLAFDRAANLYVSDFMYSITKFTPAGVGSAFPATVPV